MTGLRFVIKTMLVYLQKSIILLLVASLTLQSLAELIRFSLTLGGQLPHDEVQHG